MESDPWISYEEKRPPKDGYYMVIADLDEPQSTGIMYYNGYGFIFELNYLRPSHWKHHQIPLSYLYEKHCARKTYGKIRSEETCEKE